MLLYIFKYKELKLSILCKIVTLICSVLAFANTEQPVAKKTINISFSFPTKESIIYNAFEDFFNQEAENVGKKKNIVFKIKYTVANNNAARQAADIEDLISLKPDFLILMPHDSKAILSSIRKANSAHIPVITYNRAPAYNEKIKPVSHVGLDTLQQGYSSAKVLFELMKKDGIAPKIINVLGDLVDENAVSRSAGLKKAAQEMGAEVLQDIPTGWNPERALSGLSAALRSKPMANSIFVASDHLLPGIQTALINSGRWLPYGNPKHMYFASQDVFPIGAEYLRKHYIDVSTAFDISAMSQQTFQVIIDLLEGKKVQTEYKVIGRVFTPENIDKEPDLWSKRYK